MKKNISHESFKSFCATNGLKCLIKMLSTNKKSGLRLSFLSNEFV